MQPVDLKMIVIFLKKLIGQLKKNKSGILLYNSTTKHTWPMGNLDGNLQNTIDLIKELRGAFALIYVTEK